MSLKEILTNHLADPKFATTQVTVDKTAMVHGEEAIKITSETRFGDLIKTLEATYLKRNHLNEDEIAILFASKLDSVLRGTYEEG